MRLYEMDCRTYEPTTSDLPVKIKKVSPFSLSLAGESLGMKGKLGRLAFWVMSKGDFRIFYVTDEKTGSPVHTSYVMGRSFKFPFMEKGDIHIGPCHTAPEHRGKGIYRKVLHFIRNHEGETGKQAYMIVAENNLPSIKGIEAAGLRQIGAVERTGLLKIYRRKNHD
ncbi:MAG: hypothetical protein IKM59_04800 [Oscillospiraceae bacterium]|nr:hypothetical protein [Oscillospiraceae bacterium]